MKEPLELSGVLAALPDDAARLAYLGGVLDKSVIPADFGEIVYDEPVPPDLPLPPFEPPFPDPMPLPGPPGPDEPPTILPPGGIPDQVLEAVLRTAAGQVGYNGDGTEDAPLSKFGAWFGVNPGQWCAMFISWCFDRAGYPLPRIDTAKGFAACVSGVAWFTSAQAYTAAGPGFVPRRGDIAFYDYGMGRPSHVGLVESVAGGAYVDIEGNTGDGKVGRTGNCCRRVRHQLSDPHLLGFGRPAYGQGDDMPLSQDDLDKIADVVDQRMAYWFAALSTGKGNSVASGPEITALRKAIDAVRKDFQSMK